MVTQRRATKWSVQSNLVIDERRCRWWSNEVQEYTAYKSQRVSHSQSSKRKHSWLTHFSVITLPKLSCILWNELVLLKRELIHYQIRPLKNSVLHQSWSEKLKYKILGPVSFCHGRQTLHTFTQTSLNQPLTRLILATGNDWNDHLRESNSLF